MELQDLRQEIDAIDDQLVQLFTQRMDVAAKIADYKKANNMPILVPAREREKLMDVASIAGPAMAEYVEQLYTAIFEISRAYQTNIIKEEKQ